MEDQVVFNEPRQEDGLSLATLELVKKYQAAFAPPVSGGATVHVDEIATKVASLYEKIRGIIDWKEEHLIRRTAIERALKRRFITEISGISLAVDLQPEKMAEPLVLELVRGGHFANDQIPQAKIEVLKKTLAKYLYLLENSPWAKNGLSLEIKKKVNFYNWLLEIAACEIEEILEPPQKQSALIEFMANSMEAQIKVTPPESINQADKKTQILVAVMKTLFKLDAPIISYWLLKHHYPDWDNLSQAELAEVAGGINYLWGTIDNELNHPQANDFYRICEQYDAVFLILGDVLNNFHHQPQVIPHQLAQKEALASLVKAAYDKRLATLKTRLFRMAIFSTLSVLLSSAVSLFIVEVPLARLLYGRFNLVAILVDILLPTVLMFVLVALVKPPGKSNLEKLTSEVNKVVYQVKATGVYEIKVKKERHLLVNLVISFLYLLGSVFSLGFIFWVFLIARVPIASVYIDTLNVAVIVFAALVVRQRAQELVVEEKSRFSDFLLDIVSVPVARVGQWLAHKWKEYNIVSVFFSILIDTPFQAMVEFIENWSSFIKEKKAQLH